jgi:DNA polymerase-3 subunit gamma/tau
MSATAPATAVAPAQDPEAMALSGGATVPDKDRVRERVLSALADAGNRMLLSMLEAGEWKLDGSELTIKVAASEAVIDMSLGADAKRVITETLNAELGRPAKFKVLPGGAPQSAATSAAQRSNGRGRAEQDPIVQRLKEKFGAEIRTIIDYRDKK